MDIKTENDLFCHLYDQIMSREISTFSQLASYAAQFRTKFKKQAVMQRCFQLLQELHWGFFRAMSKSNFPRLWKELVVRHETYTFAGDLKRNISVSNIYIALLDIHGYTRFCQESRNNLSKLRKLDHFLSEGIRKIAAENGALAQRERGDEILVVAGSATDILNTVLGIINSFSREPIMRCNAVIRDRTRYGINLPDFKISAGVAGGNISTPLIVTERGNLSGFLLNTAARLQTRANELSPSESRIVTTKTIYTNFVRENQLVKSDLFSSRLLYFFDSGPLEFKGVTISSFEILFREDQKYKQHLAQPLNTLLEAIRSRLWSLKVFTDLLALIDETLINMKQFQVELDSKQGQEILSNESLLSLCNRTRTLYQQEDDYLGALDLLEDLIWRLSHVPQFDRLVTNYASCIFEKYDFIRRFYATTLQQEIDRNIDHIFNEQYKRAYYGALKSVETLEKLQTHARRKLAASTRKSHWLNLLEKHREFFEKFRIHSGKK